MDPNLVDQYHVQDALQRSQLDAQSSYQAPMLHENMQQQQAVLVSQTNPKNIVKLAEATGFLKILKKVE